MKEGPGTSRRASRDGGRHAGDQSTELSASREQGRQGASSRRRWPTRAPGGQRRRAGTSCRSPSNSGIGRRKAGRCSAGSPEMAAAAATLHAQADRLCFFSAGDGRRRLCFFVLLSHLSPTIRPPSSPRSRPARARAGIIIAGASHAYSIPVSAPMSHHARRRSCYASTCSPFAGPCSASAGWLCAAWIRWAAERERVVLLLVGLAVLSCREGWCCLCRVNRLPERETRGRFWGKKTVACVHHVLLF